MDAKPYRYHVLRWVGMVSAGLAGLVLAIFRQTSALDWGAVVVLIGGLGLAVLADHNLGLLAAGQIDQLLRDNRDLRASNQRLEDGLGSLTATLTTRLPTSKAVLVDRFLELADEVQQFSVQEMTYFFDHAPGHWPLKPDEHAEALRMEAATSELFNRSVHPKVVALLNDAIAAGVPQEILGPSLWSPIAGSAYVETLAVSQLLRIEAGKVSSALQNMPT